jgi:hypothetical protein
MFFFKNINMVNIIIISVLLTIFDIASKSISANPAMLISAL